MPAGFFPRPGCCYLKKNRAMGKTTKIEQQGLAETVQELMSQGITTRAAVTEKLVSEYGADVSEATVGRYLAKVRRAAENQAYKTITDHVNKTVPDDLEALEEMEKQALEWSREAGASQTERAADAAEKIAGELDEWKERLAGEKDAQVVRWIIKKCLGYLAADDRRQEQRLAAMKMVHKIIETKLSKAGLLDDDTKGRIVFMQRGSGDSEGEDRGEKKNIIRLVGRGDDAADQ